MNPTAPVEIDRKRELAVGRRLRLMRESADLTQKELGDRIGLTQAAISKYETNLPPTRVLLAAADVCGWTLADFFAGIEGVPRDDSPPAFARDSLALADELRELAERVTRRVATVD